MMERHTRGKQKNYVQKKKTVCLVHYQGVHHEASSNIKDCLCWVSWFNIASKLRLPWSWLWPFWFLRISVLGKRRRILHSFYKKGHDCWLCLSDKNRGNNKHKGCTSLDMWHDNISKFVFANDIKILLLRTQSPSCTWTDLPLLSALFTVHLGWSAIIKHLPSHSSGRPCWVQILE